MKHDGSYRGPRIVLTDDDAKLLYPLIPVLPQYDNVREKFHAWMNADEKSQYPNGRRG